MMTKKASKSRTKVPDNLKSWKPGTSGNPKGRPKRGESWAELIKEIGEMTGPEVADNFAYIGRTLKQYPRGATLKQLVVIRAFVSLVNEPSASLLREIMDRSEGKVADSAQPERTVSITGWQDALKRVYGQDAIRVVVYGELSERSDQEPASETGQDERS
jgi:hypothetical protein